MDTPVTLGQSPLTCPARRPGQHQIPGDGYLESGLPANRDPCRGNYARLGDVGHRSGWAQSHELPRGYHPPEPWVRCPLDRCHGPRPVSAALLHAHPNAVKDPPGGPDARGPVVANESPFGPYLGWTPGKAPLVVLGRGLTATGHTRRSALVESGKAAPMRTGGAAWLVRPPPSCCPSWGQSFGGAPPPNRT